MKNLSIIAWTLFIAFVFSAFTFLNWNGQSINETASQSVKEVEPPRFFYNLNAQANNTITKKRLHNATSILDLIPDAVIQNNLKQNIIGVRDVAIKRDVGYAEQIVLKSAFGNQIELSTEQIDFLRSVDYESKFRLEGYFTAGGFIKDINKEKHFNYNLAVVPETQASYKSGRDAFIDFFKEECQTEIAQVQASDLKFGQISFTVTSAGILSNIDLNSSCGYTAIDNKMLALINILPDGWNVAVDSNGKKVNQTLLFSFGQGGC